jgi:hypothetical protein
MPSADKFVREVAGSLKSGGLRFFAEPSGHVKPEKFQQELEAARTAGLETLDRPEVRRSHAVVLRKP